MKYNYLILALAAVALFSCTGKEAVDPESEGELVTIRAYQEGATETRTTLVDGGTQVYWEPSDEIKVFFRGSGSRFASQNTTNADVAEFSGSINVVVGINEGASDSNTLWGLYPYRADATSDGESVTTTLPTEQTGRAGSFAKNTFITLAQSNSFDLAFYNVTGGIRFSLTQEGVKEVVFEGLNNEDIAGKVKLAFADGVPVVKEVIEGKKSITLSAPNGGTFDTGKWYYIVALPSTLSGGFKMTFNTATQTATLKSSGAKTIKRGIFGSLADADEGLIYKDKGGDEPQTGNIVFADLAAKYACVAKFDTNGDGEVSYEEAEVATSFDGLFDNWKGVVSFDEIRYFKNVHSLSGVFSECSKLVSITVPESITDLGTSAFNECYALTSVVLPSGITSIGDYTFATCTSLSSIDIPSSVTSIGEGAFHGCESLTAIELPPEVSYISDYTFMGCHSLSSVDIPSSVTSIGINAFSDCTSLRSIDIPSSVTSIGDYAFNYCNSMVSVNLSSQLKTIGQYAFSDCKSLTQVTIPDSVTSLGRNVFSGCSKLTTAYVPGSITTIPDFCFQNCSSLTSVTVSEGVTTIEFCAFSGVAMWKLELPSSISSLGFPDFRDIVCVILPSTSPVSISNDTFSDVGAIFVPANMVALYRAMTNWSNFASNIYPLDAYEEKSEFTLVTSGAVDMGVSVKWAAYNVGATAPEEYGDYYAWGETETKNTYSWSTYLDSPNRDGKSFSKYFQGEGGKSILDPEDDVAYIKWGSNWRMPTYEEWIELITHCGCEWTTYKGINGRMIYDFGSRNAIFIPAAGYHWNSKLIRDDTTNGFYWTSSLSENSSVAKYGTIKNPSNDGALIGSRCAGLSVRSVYAE